MNLINKNKPEYSVQFYLMYPRFSWRRPHITFRNNIEETTEINLNLFKFRLTNNKNYVIVELCLVFGLGLKIIEKEK